MKICFYWLNLQTPPGMSVGVSILANELSQAGHETSVLHLNERVGVELEDEYIKEHVRRGSFDLHALSFGQNHYPAARRLARLIKEADPDTLILCGGIHTTLNPEQVLQESDVDFIGLGEVDGLLSRFVENLERGKYPEKTPNFWAKDGDKILHNALSALPDISRQTLPFFDGIDYEGIIKANRGFAETVVGRGCPMDCNYCHNRAIQEAYNRNAEKRVRRSAFCRLRSVENVIEELSAYKSRFARDLKAFNFGDDRFASDSGWLRSFSVSYVDSIGLPFICNAIAGQLGTDAAGLLAEAGCNMVKFGVESGSRRLRHEVLGRQLSEGKLADSVAKLRKLGVNTRAYVMLGIPSETKEEMLSTIRLCAQLRFDSVRPAIVYPYPGTQLHRYCLDKGFLEEGQAVPGDYSTTTVLNVSRSERVRIEKAAACYFLLLNTFLEGRAAELSRPLLARVDGISEDAWTVEEGRKLISEEGSGLHEKLASAGVQHYFAPFGDRPDVIFLFRKRERPLISVEDQIGRGY